MNTTDFNNNPNRLLAHAAEMSKNLQKKLGSLQGTMSMMEKDKDYNFVYKGKKGKMLVLKSKVMSLEIEGVTDNEIRDILKLLNDRHT